MKLKTLSDRGLTLLTLDAGHWRAIQETRRGGSRFSLTFPHELAREARQKSLVIVSIPGASSELRIAFVQSIQSVATFDSRVLFDLVQPISPNTIADLLDRVVDPKLRVSVRRLRDNTDGFCAVSPKLGQTLIRFIAEIPDNRSALQRIISRLERPKYFDNARAMEYDAVGLALKAFGVVRGATKLDLSGDTALETVRLMEDTVIEHDARWIPGWDMVDSDVTGRAVFVSPDHQQLEVVTANKRPLEQLLGVDLIYFHQTRKSLVMVQYKMMERGERKRHRIQRGVYESEVEDQEWIVSIDKQFKDELARMVQFDRDLDPKGPYRLNSSPFFHKLVRRHASTGSASIMMSLGHLSQMISEGSASGPRGGLQISYRRLDGHYLRGEAFVDLVRSGYIGTRGATTEHMLTLIEAALAGGRAVVAAVQSRMETKIVQHI